jgi:ribosomal protein L25 (general stress protein Ctc)
MKKEYIAPTQITCKLLSEKGISTSERIKTSGSVDDIIYGGIDEEGTIEPSVKVLSNIWDDEW